MLRQCRFLAPAISVTARYASEALSSAYLANASLRAGGPERMDLLQALEGTVSRSLPPRSLRRALAAACLCLLVLFLTACPGPGSGAPPDIPPSTFEVDTDVTPRLDELPGLDDGEPRSVAALVDENGTQAEFVVNELILTTADPDQASAFVQRWQGEVLDSFDPTELGLTDVAAWYLVRVTTPAADLEQLAQQLKRSVPGARNDLRFGSQAALDLFGLFVAESAAGLSVTPNWVGLPQGLESGANNEGAGGTVPGGATPPGGAPAYAADANTWPYMQVGGGMDIGVVAAWRTLSLANRLGNKVGVAVLDGGFRDSPDMAGATIYGGFDVQNPAACGGSPCPWHGTGTSSAAFAAVGNGSGVAGPGGPVANRILVQSPSDVWSLLPYMANLFSGVAGARIINISATFVLPATAAALAAGPMELMALTMRAAGFLVVAAAGNEGLNLDDEDCFIVCWAKRTAFPCELGNVVCVGALNWADRNRAGFSNYGSNVDLFGPGYVWAVDPDNVANAKLSSGTSLASPFVAGVAALVWAGDPGLSPGGVESILLNTAHTNNGGGVGRVVNAAAAVRNAVGNAPPVIRLRANPIEVGLRVPVTLFSRSQQPVGSAFFSVYDEDMDPNVANVVVQVTSDRDGIIHWDGHLAEGVGDGFKTPGQRTLSITATDPGGASSTATLTVNVVNTPPSVTNVEAPTTIGLAEGWAPVKPVIATDPNEPGGRLACNRVTWSVQGNDLPSPGSGCDTFVVFSEQGTRTVTITATDPEGATGTLVLSVNVGPRPAQIPPSVSGFVVRDRNNAVLEDRTDLYNGQCPLTATATIYNPDSMPVDLSWYLDNGTSLVDGHITPTGTEGQIQITCAGLEYERLHFLSLFVGDGAPKKVFAFRAPPPPGPN